MRNRSQSVLFGVIGFKAILSASTIGLAVALVACAGDPGNPGNPGANALVTSIPEPAGPNCPYGGTKVSVGLDADGNGVLDASEVKATGTSYICNGAGQSSLVVTGAEPGGAHCPFGGTKIETGLDANNNNTLDAAEVNAAATSYVCNVAPSGAISPSTGIVVAVRPGGVSTSTTDPITVRFTMKDDRGFPLDVAGRYSQNTQIQPRFALAHFTKDPTTGVVSPLTVYTKSASTAAPAGQPTSFNPLTAGNGTLVENGLGAGDYTYTFPTTSIPNGPMAVAYDPAKLNETHVVWIQASRQTDAVFTANANTFYAANEPYYYVPAGTGTPLVREVVSQAGCDGCHAKFKAESTASAAFHGGGRVDAGMCNVCHNPGRTTNPSANSASFIHRIHNGENVATANLFHGIAATYPRDVRDCSTCHANAAQGAQAQTNPSAIACKGCHDYVSFTNTPGIEACKVFGQLDRGIDGKPAPCNHVAGPRADTTCITCHGPGTSFAAETFHKPVTPPDPNNAWLVPVNLGGNANTNASFVAAGGYVPPGASVITYDLKSVTTVPDTVTPSIKRPQMVFKLKRDGTDVVFQTFNPSATPPVTELMPGFVGSPSVYFAFAVPQDGIEKPSDFNASVNGYLKKIWDGSAIGANAGVLSGPDGSGYYTLKLTGVQIPSTATMLTGGIGYGYSLAATAPASPTPPLVQTNVEGYPWTPSGLNDGKAQGGLSIPAPNVWKVVTTTPVTPGRRAIVDNANCKNCHGALGVAPTFHAGERNDGPTCSFCHNPNRTSSGWSAGSKYFIHAIHAGRKRITPFTWHAAAKGPGYDEVEFPGTLNACTTCHFPNTYDFTNTTNLDAVPSMELTTVATGKYNIDPLANSTYYTISPYVTADNVMDYGLGFSYDAVTNQTREAAGTTLVLSPITSACSSCHDSSPAIDHMKANGGQFYSPRQTVLAPGAAKEQCLLCHGPGRVAAIGVVHQR